MRPIPVFFLSALFAPILMLPSWGEEKPTRRPNVVLIMADDMGYECLSANGSLDYKTPNIDRLASNGLRFQHCHAQPLCTPTRVKLMTGQSNKRNYVKFGVLDRKQKTFGHLFQQAGYKTCIAGKWQLGRELDAPQHFGFQQSLLWQHTRGRTAGPDKRDTRFPNPRLEKNGKELDYNDGEFSSDLFVDFISEFMQANKEEPFFVYYPMALVHCPFCPTPDSKDWDPTSHGSKTYKGDPRYFADMVAYTDKMVGRIDSKLKELGLRDNTLLIFTGDNGTDTPIVTNTTYGKVIGAKGQMVDGGNRVPFVVSWPGVIKEGRVVNNIIDLSDVLPTICEAAHVDIPKKLTIDGKSLVPLINDPNAKHRDSIYVWYSRNGAKKNAKAFARNERYKLYASGKMFDVPNDRLEKKPLDQSKLTSDQESVRRMLQEKLDEFADVTRRGRK